jgi:hypothetical protein
MKKYLLAAIMLFCAAGAFSQPKPKQKEKPPTQKELADMMKEMQAELNGMSAEDKKVLDSLGFKMPDVKSIQKNTAGITDAQLKKAFEDDNRIIPVKDAARINMAATAKVSNAEMGAYISKAHQTVLDKLTAATKSQSAEILQELLKQNESVANAAAGLWMDGKPTVALYLMGAACKADPSDPISLNNYASFLTMC